jgi:hypothetical protein
MTSRGHGRARWAKSKISAAKTGRELSDSYLARSIPAGKPYRAKTLDVRFSIGTKSRVS